MFNEFVLSQISIESSELDDFDVPMAGEVTAFNGSEPVSDILNDLKLVFAVGEAHGLVALLSWHRGCLGLRRLTTCRVVVIPTLRFASSLKKFWLWV